MSVYLKCYLGVWMAEELAEIKREVALIKRRIADIENRVHEIEAKLLPEEEKIKKLINELKKEYPNMRFDEKSLKILRLVGTLPYIPSENERAQIVKAIAERYE